MIEKNEDESYTYTNGNKIVKFTMDENGNITLISITIKPNNNENGV